MKRLLIASAMGSILLLASCGAGFSNTRMRAVHLSPDSGGLDVEVDGSRIATNVRYLGSSAYQRVGRGDHLIDVFVSGSNVLSNDANLARDTDYSLLLTGFRGSLFPTLITDDNEPPPAGQFRLRFIHASPNAGAADFYALAGSTEINTAAPQFVLARFGTNAGYVTLTAGTYDFQVTAAGTKTSVVDTGPVAMAAGQVRTAVLVNAPAGSASPFTVVFLSDAN